MDEQTAYAVVAFAVKEDHRHKLWMSAESYREPRKRQNERKYDRIRKDADAYCASY